MNQRSSFQLLPWRARHFACISLYLLLSACASQLPINTQQAIDDAIAEAVSAPVPDTITPPVRQAGQSG